MRFESRVQRPWAKTRAFSGVTGSGVQKSDVGESGVAGSDVMESSVTESSVRKPSAYAAKAAPDGIGGVVCVSRAHTRCRSAATAWAPEPSGAPSAIWAMPCVATAFRSAMLRLPTGSQPLRGGAKAAQPTWTVVGGSEKAEIPRRARRSDTLASDTVTSTSAGSPRAMTRSPMIAPAVIRPWPGRTPTYAASAIPCDCNRIAPSGSRERARLM